MKNFKKSVVIGVLLGFMVFMGMTRLVAQQLHDTVNVILYYSKGGRENPDGSKGIPNWFYYWKQTAASVTDVEIRYDPSLQPYGRYKDGTTYIRVGPYVAQDTNTLGGKGICLRRNSSCGRTDIDGIDLFAATLRHERMHYIAYKIKSETPQCQGDFRWFAPDCDADGDGLENNFELAHHLDPNNSNTQDDVLGTYGFWRDEYDDNESLAYCTECDEWVVGRADPEDWSEGGHQW